MGRAPPLVAPAMGLDVVRALLRYEGPARELVARLKYRNDRAALGWLADNMASLLRPPAGVVVTWMPTTDRRRRRRGFDQAELLARAVARRWRVPAVGLLHRHGAVAQTGRTRAERREGFTVETRRRLTDPARIVLVDDVVTTGTTLRCGALSLRSAGAVWIAGLTAARTP